jgi:hypothetical protein
MVKLKLHNANVFAMVLFMVVLMVVVVVVVMIVEPRDEVRVAVVFLAVGDVVPAIRTQMPAPCSLFGAPLVIARA